jgi:hypothetical protein
LLFWSASVGYQRACLQAGCHWNKFGMNVYLDVKKALQCCLLFQSWSVLDLGELRNSHWVLWCCKVWDTELTITNLVLDVWVIMQNPLTWFLSLNRSSSLQAQWSVIATYDGITHYIIDYIYPQGLGALKTVSLFWIFFLNLIVPFVPRDVFCHHFW